MFHIIKLTDGTTLIRTEEKKGKTHSSCVPMWKTKCAVKEKNGPVSFLLPDILLASLASLFSVLTFHMIEKVTLSQHSQFSTKWLKICYRTQVIWRSVQMNWEKTNHLYCDVHLPVSVFPKHICTSVTATLPAASFKSFCLVWKCQGMYYTAIRCNGSPTVQRKARRVINQFCRSGIKIFFFRFVEKYKSTLKIKKERKEK